MAKAVYIAVCIHEINLVHKADLGFNIAAHFLASLASGYMHVGMKTLNCVWEMYLFVSPWKPSIHHSNSASTLTLILVLCNMYNSYI